MKDKKMFKNLKNKLGQDIDDEINREKNRLRSKKKAMEEQEKRAASSDEAPRRLRAGNKSRGQMSAGFGGYSPFGGFGGFGGSSSNQSSGRTQSSSKGFGFGDFFSNPFGSIESFFDNIGGGSSNDYDQLESMSNQDIMKMFYNNGPQQQQKIRH